ncbi:hypothetical protein FNU79_16395 [Deinococcus detaillensis]|uniref:DUF4352 domain-containing protein n=1 Tax=Deinococcus detaillensis TaxID=2592048 RepID=A0A553UK66_9DEIO|nr:hypothetical protein [Deinococcus detaillensis]TSA80604.1 hypothetical protein FNU79_16395 [Deinococcus detaillensis]
MKTNLKAPFALKKAAPLTFGLLTLFSVSLSACGRAPATTAATPPADNSKLQTLGVVEVTISGIGGPQLRSSARLLRPAWPLALPEQAAGLDLQALSTSVFNLGSRNAGTGERYIAATFKVRNAGSDGTASSVARSNLTLIAASSASAQDSSAISAMKTFDGTSINTGLARSILPTHAMVFQPSSSAATLSSGGEDFQVFSEAEITPNNFTHAGVALTSYADLGVTTVFPYGYVVRNPTAPAGAAQRTLSANPAAGQYDGRVALAVKVPLQPDDPAKTPSEGAKRDPFSFSMLFVIVADPTTSVTQSLQEQSQGNTAVYARATGVAATNVNVLPGSSAALGSSGGVTTRRICQVRTAGLVGDVSPAPTYLINTCP